MSAQDRFDRTLAGWFESDAGAAAPAGHLERVLEATHRRRPLPAWLAGFGGGWVGTVAGSGAVGRSLAPARLRWSITFALLLLALALVGGAILVGARFVRHAPPTAQLGHLAFGKDGDIYVADWDGRNAVRIADGAPDGESAPDTCGSFWGEGAIWSPDGRHMAYRSDWNDVCEGSVYIADADGNIVSSFPGNGWLISWSPDSTRVVTWLASPYELAPVAVYGVDGVRQAVLTLPPAFRMSGDHDPFWSPDGTSIVVPHGLELPLDGRTPRTLPAGDPRGYPDRTYSPDGRRAAYFDNRTLYIASSDGSDRRALIPRIEDDRSGASSPLWSPTGDQIAFVTVLEGRTASGPTIDVGTDIRVVNVTSGAMTTLVALDEGAYLNLIKFSPDGDGLLYSRTDDSTVALWTIGTDGSGKRELVNGSGWGDWQWVSDAS